MLANVAQQLVDMFEVDHSGVLFFGSEDTEGVVLAEYPPQEAVGLKVPLTDYPLTDQLKREHRPIAVLDAQNDSIMGNARPIMRNLGIQSILIVPLIVRSRIVGSFSLDAIKNKRQFTAEEIALCHIIGNQIAVAIDYTRALETVEENQRQAQTLREVNRVLSESLNLDEILPRILDQLEKVVPADASSVYLMVEDGVQLVATRGRYNPFAEHQVIPLDRLWGASEIIKNKAPLLVRQARQHPHWRVYPGSPVQSWLGVPLLVRGEVVGVLNIDGYSANQFDEGHIQLVQSFANQAAMAIYNARLYGQANKRAEMLASVQEIGLSMVASLELEDVLREVTTSVLNLLEAGQVRIYLYKAEDDSFSLAATTDSEGGLKIRTMMPRKDGLTATVARSGRFMAIQDIFQHPLYREEADTQGFGAIIGVPLTKRDRVLGVLNVFYAEPHYFSEDEINMLHLLATQAAVALENARLYGAEQSRLHDEARRVERLRRVQEISSHLNSSLELDKVLNNACQQFVRLMEVDHCGIVLFDDPGETGLVVAEYPPTGAAGAQISLDYPAVKQMLVDRQPFASFNVLADPALGPGADSLKQLGVQSILILPLVLQEQVIGSIGLDAMLQPRRFTEEEMNMGRIVADQMAIAVANARTYQAERAARDQADTLREVAAILNETLDLDELLQRILAQLKRVITYDSSSILLRSKDRFTIVATQGFAEPEKVLGMTFAFAAKPHFQEIARTRRPLLIPDTARFAGWRQEGPTAIRSWLGAPLAGSDQLIGILAVDHCQPDFYSQADAELLTAFAHLAVIALENARLYEFEVKQVEQELRIARQIQQGLFPRRIPDLPGWQIAAVCLPARETGGDFFDFIKRADGKIGIAVGDVSGKGISAAMVMAAAQSVVGAKGTDHMSPAKVLRETNHMLCDDMPENTFVALAYALLEPQGDTVLLSNGGQLAPFLLPARGRGAASLVETPGSHLPVGIVTETVYEDGAWTLQPGDSLVFHTDGIVERKNERGKLFGFERLASVLNQLRGRPPQVILDTILQAVDDFAGGVGQADDVTLVVIQRQG